MIDAPCWRWQGWPMEILGRDASHPAAYGQLLRDRVDPATWAAAACNACCNGYNLRFVDVVMRRCGSISASSGWWHVICFTDLCPSP